MSEQPKWATEDSGLELDWKDRTKPEQRAEAAARQDMARQDVSGAGKGLPGEPRYMGPELTHALASLFEGPGLQVRQQREWGEALLGWETRNRYEVIDADGRFLLYAGETGQGLGAALLRNFLPIRPVEIEFMTSGGTLALRLARVFTLFFTRVEVTAWDGRPLGYIQQRFGLIKRHFELCTPAGGVMARLEGPIWKPWTFHVHVHDEEVATIRKRWSGFVSEGFTDADNFGVEFHAGLKDGRLRQMVLAATLMVDLCYFEERKGSGTLTGLLSD